MNCFTHSDEVAVGTCGACQRGVCRSCAVEVGFKLACRTRCEERVRMLVQVENLGIEALGQANRIAIFARKAYLGLALFLVITGICLAALAIPHPELQWLTVTGCVFLVFGLATFWAVRRLPKQLNSEIPVHQSQLLTDR